MRKEASLPVRLDTELSLRLDKAAERLGLTKSALIRILVKSFVERLEANGGQIVLPLTWKSEPTFPTVPKAAESTTPYPTAPRKRRERKA